MPSNSTGFWVARTRNGSGRGRVVPSTETWRSCIASSSADCVRGVARLISSTSRTFVNTGPWTKRRPAGSNRLAPVTSVGQQVGRALDAGGVERRGPGDGAGEQRLAGARDVLEQHVAVGEQRDRDQPHRLVAADHGPPDGAAQVGPEAAARPSAGRPRRRSRTRSRPCAAAPPIAAWARRGSLLAARAGVPPNAVAEAATHAVSSVERARSVTVARGARVAPVARPHPRPARPDPRPGRGVPHRHARAGRSTCRRACSSTRRARRRSCRR